MIAIFTGNHYLHCLFSYFLRNLVNTLPKQFGSIRILRQGLPALLDHRKKRVENILAGVRFDPGLLPGLPQPPEKT